MWVYVQHVICSADKVIVRLTSKKDNQHIAHLHARHVAS